MLISHSQCICMSELVKAMLVREFLKFKSGEYKSRIIETSYAKSKDVSSKDPVPTYSWIQVCLNHQ